MTFNKTVFFSFLFEERKTLIPNCTKNEVSIKDSFSKCDQIRSFLRIWSHFVKKSLMENFIFCAVLIDMIITKLIISA